jgi:hypothetical protein
METFVAVRLAGMTRMCSSLASSVEDVAHCSEAVMLFPGAASQHQSLITAVFTAILLLPSSLRRLHGL